MNNDEDSESGDSDDSAGSLFNNKTKAVAVVKKEEPTPAVKQEPPTDTPTLSV